jgi:hypothetical protein
MTLWRTPKSLHRWKAMRIVRRVLHPVAKMRAALVTSAWELPWPGGVSGLARIVHPLMKRAKMRVGKKDALVI